jgi:hypothetical protein
VSLAEAASAAAREIHLPAVPLAALGRVFAPDRDRPPVGVDAKLRIAEPLRVPVCVERLPRRARCGGRIRRLSDCRPSAWRKPPSPPGTSPR